MSVNSPAYFDHDRGRVVFKTSCVPGDLSESVLDAQRGSWTLEGASKWTSCARKSWSEGRLGLVGGLPVERLGPQRPAGRLSWRPFTVTVYSYSYPATYSLQYYYLLIAHQLDNISL